MICFYGHCPLPLEKYYDKERDVTAVLNVNLNGSPIAILHMIRCRLNAHIENGQRQYAENSDCCKGRLDAANERNKGLDEHKIIRTTGEDHGYGIAPEMREHIFRHFLATKNRHGALGLETESEEYTRFRLDLPAGNQEGQPEWDS